MDLIGRSAEMFGSLPALLAPEETVTFRNCNERARRIAGILLNKGLQPGDIVAVLSPNTPRMALLLLGLLKAGMVAAPLNCRFPDHLVRVTIEKLRPRLLLCDENSLSSFPGITTGSISSILEKAAAFPSEGSPVPYSDWERPVTAIHTSASTGAPKTALHSFSNHWYNALGSNDNIPFIPGDCWLLSLPFYHIGGYAILFRVLASGASMAVGNPGESIDITIGQFPVTHLSLVPTQLYRLLADRKTAALLRRMKAVLLGGSPVPKSLIEQAVQNRIPIYLSYGSTEMGSQISTSPGPLDGVRQDSGRVLPFREIMEADDGELLVRGKCLFLGYLNEGTLNAQRDSGGWYHTSDIGHVSEDGIVTVLGRKDNMFITGGENIHPEEIEKGLMTIEGIMDAVVVPVPDNEYGQRPAAFIRTFVEGSPDDASLHCRMQKLVGKLRSPVRYQRVSDWAVLPGSRKTDREFYRKLLLEP
jgi:O-succinylbenzoic acid--CoA ligase